MQIYSQSAAELAEMWENGRASNKLPSNMRHSDLLGYVDGLKKLGVRVNEVGRSYADREIFQIEWGRGPLRVFMWSQMHGDEPTATPALIDMFTILQNNRDKEWIKQIEEKITIRAVPMLNPDGAELFIRRNLQGIDINRDARDLRTPEARLLKRLRDEWSPDIGFNLHNQNPLTAAGSGGRQVAMAFLVVFGDAAKTTNDGHERNKRLAAAMVDALREFIPGQIARYGDEWTPSAFGDSFSSRGTPTILIETGGAHGRDEMFLVKMNFVAFMTALNALASGSEREIDLMGYEILPENTARQLMNVIFRNVTLIGRSGPENEAATNIGINFERRRAGSLIPAYVRRLGDLSDVRGLDEYDAEGFKVFGRFQPFGVGSLGDLLFYQKDRAVDWAAPDLETQFPPDAVFSLGRWVSGEGLMKKRSAE
jgi:hypothetical protein